MHPFGELSAQRRRLGAALRRLRVEAGLSGEQVAAMLGISQSQVSRIELGQQAAPVEITERWAQVTGASAERHAELTAWAGSAATELVAWRKAMSRGLVRLQQDSRDLEASAATIRNFQPARIPGLLQVPEYARRTFAAGHPPGQPDIAAAVAVRMDRQAVLYDQSKHLEFVITEAALRWRLGPPALMLAQLDRIDVTCTLENVAVSVIPQDAEVGEWHDHAFTILDDRADGGPVVHVETLTSGLTITDAAEAARYHDAFARLRKAAVAGADARAILRRIRRAYEPPDASREHVPR
jgi:transcriptional regulator with XRE-family HTH domain